MSTYGEDADVSGDLEVAGTMYTPVDSLTLADTISTDASTGNVFTVTLTGSGMPTLANPSNLESGAVYRWIVKQDSAGGSDLFFGSNFQFPSGLPPSMISSSLGVNILEGVSDGTYVYLTSNSIVTGSYVSGSEAGHHGEGSWIFDEIQKSATLEYWFDATDIDTITKDGSNLVSNWIDKADDRTDATQDNATEKPTYDADGLNGFPCITFNGSDNMMYIGSEGSDEGFESDTLTYFIVCGFTDSNDGHIVGVGSTADGYLESYGQGMYTESGKYGVKSKSGSGIALKSSDTVNDGDTFILRGTIRENNSTLHSQGIQDAADTSNSPNAHTAYTQATIGASDGSNDGGPEDFWGGNLGEIIIFTGPGLSDVQIRSIEKYLAIKWGISADYRT